jgi:hypothetical protein
VIFEFSIKRRTFLTKIRVSNAKFKFLKFYFTKIRNSSTQVGDREMVEKSIDRDFKTKQTQGFVNFQILRDHGFLEDLCKTIFVIKLTFHFFSSSKAQFLPFYGFSNDKLIKIPHVNTEHGHNNHIIVILSIVYVQTN